MRLFYFIILFLSVLSLGSCKTSEKVLDVRKSTDTLVVYRDRTDSVTIRDSVVISLKGDTVVQYEVKYIEKLKVRTDSVYLSKIDTIKIEVEKMTEKPLSVREKVALWIGSNLWWAIVLALLLIFIKIKENLK